MLKKVMALLAVLVLLLATAQLALAQQEDTTPTQPVNATQQDTGGTQTSGVGPNTGADPAGQNDASQTQPAGGSQPSTVGLMRLNQNNELVIDCQAVSDKLAQLKATPANAAQPQAALVGTEELSQLCADGGFTPATGGGSTQPSSNDAGTTQPQQSQGTSTPASNGGNNGTSPNDTVSMQPNQAQATHVV